MKLGDQLKGQKEEAVTTVVPAAQKKVEIIRNIKVTNKNVVLARIISMIKATDFMIRIRIKLEMNNNV